MSHYTVLVTKTNKVPLDEQLEPFDEALEVAPYLTDCGCIGDIATNAAYDQAEAQLGKTVDDYRKEWTAHSRTWQDSHNWAEFIQPHSELTAKLEQDHPLRGQPDPDCEECAGTGQCDTTYNRDRTWDWYSVGGRWSGYLKLRPDTAGKLGDAGYGNTAPLHDADIAQASDIDWASMYQAAQARAGARWQAYQDKVATGEPCSPYFDYAVRPDDTRESYIARQGAAATYAVLHEGEWHAIGNMGWFGISDDERPQADWDAEFKQIIGSLDPNDEVTVVDCHI